MVVIMVNRALARRVVRVTRRGFFFFFRRRSDEQSVAWDDSWRMNE